MSTYRLLSLAAVSLVLTLPVTGNAQTPGGQLIVVDFYEVPVEVLAKEVAAATGKTIVVRPSILGPLTLKASQPVTPDMLYSAFLVVLKSHGYHVEEKDGTVYVGPNP
jgi:type II secretory pathway component GspD/PulD (secretin)